MARTVNKYIVPDAGDIPQTRAGAIKRIQQVFAANRQAIAASMYEYAEFDKDAIIPDPYDFFEGRVLERLSEKYGGEDARRRVKNKKTGRWEENDVNIEEAIDKSLNSWSLTPPAERAKRNFLHAIRNSNERMFNYIKSRMGVITREHGYFDGIPLGDIQYDDTAEHSTYLIRTTNGKFLRAVFHSDGNDSPKWHLYDENGQELIF